MPLVSAALDMHKIQQLMYLCLPHDSTANAEEEKCQKG